jgi:hypothetical protein
VVLLEVPLISIRRKFQWLSSMKNVTKFRESYERLCDIKEDPQLETISYESIPEEEKQSLIPDDLDIVVQKSGVMDDASPKNIFRNSGIHMLKPAPITIIPKTYDKKLKVVVFQRNSKRIIEDVDVVMEKLSNHLNSKTDSKWDIEYFEHDNNRWYIKSPLH